MAKKRSQRNSRKKRIDQYRLPGVIVANQHRYRTSHLDKGDPELKYLQYSNPQVVLTSTGVSSLINGCVQGTDSTNQRIGRKIVMKSISVRGAVQNTVTSLNNAAFFAGSDAIKVALVYDKQNDGVATTYSVPWSTVGAFNAPFSNPDTSQVDRFIYLWETILTVCATDSTIAVFDVTFPCDLEVRFLNSNNGNATDINSGALYLMYADNNNTAGNQATMSFSSQVTFVDE